MATGGVAPSRESIVSDPDEEEEEPVPFGTVVCYNHPKMKARMVCLEKMCSHPVIKRMECVCYKCAKKFHRRHKQRTIEEHIEISKQNIQKYINDIEHSKVPQLKARIKEFEEIVETNERNKDHIKQQIIERGELVKKSIEKETRRITRQFIQNKIENEAKLNAHIENLENIQREYLLNYQKYEMDLEEAEETNDAALIEEAKSRVPPVPTLPQSPALTESRFVPGERENETIQSILGTISVGGRDIRELLPDEEDDEENGDGKGVIWFQDNDSIFQQMKSITDESTILKAQCANIARLTAGSRTILQAVEDENAETSTANAEDATRTADTCENSVQTENDDPMTDGYTDDETDTTTYIHKSCEELD